MEPHSSILLVLGCCRSAHHCCLATAWEVAGRACLRYRRCLAPINRSSSYACTGNARYNPRDVGRSSSLQFKAASCPSCGNDVMVIVV